MAIVLKFTSIQSFRLQGSSGTKRRAALVGPNLDTAAWCSLHGYTPLLGSLNPVEVDLRSEHLRVLHLVGSEDTNTPPAFVESAAARTGAIGSVHIITGYNHNCCWQKIWASVLNDSLPRGHNESQMQYSGN